MSTVKKKIICWISCVFLMLLIGGIVLFSFNDSTKYGLLKMNGMDITKKNVMIHSDYTELPLTEMMKSLGMNVNWIDKSTAEITYKNKKYTLNLSKVSLVEDGQKCNLILPPPGDNIRYKVLEKELILDSNTIKSIMYQMGIKIDIDINYKEQIVYIFDSTMS